MRDATDGEGVACMITVQGDRRQRLSDFGLQQLFSKCVPGSMTIC